MGDIFVAAGFVALSIKMYIGQAIVQASHCLLEALRAKLVSVSSRMPE